VPKLGNEVRRRKQSDKIQQHNVSHAACFQHRYRSGPAHLESGDWKDVRVLAFSFTPVDTGMWLCHEARVAEVVAIENPGFF
jgi:hypothetical protein